MKIVVNIPKDIYDECNGNVYFPDTGAIVWDAVANGTPLPKGCGRLANADKVIDSLKGMEKLHIDDELRSGILEAINSNILVEADKGEEE